MTQVICSKHWPKCKILWNETLGFQTQSPSKAHFLYQLDWETEKHNLYNNFDKGTCSRISCVKKLLEIGNQAAAQLILGYLSDSIKAYVPKADRQDAREMLLKLQELCAPLTYADRETAMKELSDLKMFPKELVTNFLTIFHRKVELVQAIDLPNVTPLSEFQII